MIYEINKRGDSKPVPVKTSNLTEQGWQEKDLENYLFKHLPEIVSSDLMVIGQSSAYQEVVDLLALDREGDLWLFELKKVQSSAENILQVLRYSQSMAGASIDELDSVYTKHTSNREKSLAVSFCDYFGYDTNRAAEWGDKIGRTHHMVVVTDGTDDDTLSAIAHWQKQGLDIQAWSYRVYAGNEGAFQLELPELYIHGRRISEKLPSVFLVNTNRKSDPRSDSEDYMLSHECALTTGEPWIWQIFNITAGSKVMLYANKVGIIALGIATADRRMSELNDDKMHYVKLRDFKKLKKPLAPAEIQAAGKKQYGFLKSVLELRGENGMLVWKEALKRS